MAATDQQYTPFFTGHIAAWVRQHRKLVLLSWLVIAVALIGTCFTVGANEDLQETLPGESGEALEILQDRFDFGDDGGVSETIVFSHPTLTVDDPEYETVVQTLLGDLRDLRTTFTTTFGNTDRVSSYRLFSKTLGHYDIGAPRDGSPLVSTSESQGDVTFAQAEYSKEIYASSKDVAEINRLVSETAAASGFGILIGGGATLEEEITAIIEEDFNAASMLNLPLTLFILLIALGGLVAAGVPVVLAYAGVAMAAGVIALVSNVIPMMDAWLQIVLLMGLAAGIDYTLFLFTRFRSEREQGRSSAEAAAAASHTAGKAVLIAGLTTMLALLGMFLIRIVVFDSIGVAAVLTILMVLLMALTLTPALLGDGLSRFNVPYIGRRFKLALAGLLHPLARWVVGISGWWPFVAAPWASRAMLALASPLRVRNLG
ncbi:MAG: MMPL family transporter, partial [Chloroflexi bacterium]|nr:MMPL family transporter [Chloroflexota bacterium]